MHALLLQIGRQFLPEPAVNRFVDTLVAGENERHIEDIHRRDDTRPAPDRIQPHIHTAAHDRVIHILVIEKLSGGINGNFHRALRFFRHLRLELLHRFDQGMTRRKRRRHFETHLAPRWLCRFFTAAARRESRCRQKCRRDCVFPCLFHVRFLLYLYL